MFNWWSSLGPQASQSSENVGEKAAEGEQNTEGCSGDGGKDKIDSEQRQMSQDSKASELDYAKDMAKNVGSKLNNLSEFCRFGLYKECFTDSTILLTTLPYKCK